MKEALTEKQKKFVKEYLKDFNATRAAKEAGYSGKTARNIGQENLTKPNIQEYLMKMQKERQIKYDLNEAQIINELKNIAFSRISDYASIDYGMSLTGKIKDTVIFKHTDELSDEQIAAIDEISKTDKGNIKIKLHDKLRALELLGKHIGMFKEKVKVEGNVELTDSDKELLKKVERRLSDQNIE